MLTKKNQNLIAANFCFLLIALFLMLITTPVLAKQQEVGKILMATIGVTAQQPGQKPRTLARRSAVFLGDTLKTPEGGRAQLRMADGEMISLTAASELKIEAFDYQPDNQEAKDTNVKRLVTGGLRTITGAVKGEGYEMKSRAGTIGIRGTAFEMYSQQGENLYVRIQRGNVFVANAQGSVDIGVNQRLMAARIGGINQAPESISLSDLPQFFEDAFAEDTTLSLATGGEQQQASQQEESTLLIFSRASAPEVLLQASQQIEVGEIENYIEVARQPKLGPFGFVVGEKRDENQKQIFFAGQFFNTPITIKKEPEYSYSFNGQQGQGVLGAGAKSNFNFNCRGRDCEAIDLGDAKVYHNYGYDDGYGNINFVFATQIHATLASLPASGNYKYSLVSGLGNSHDLYDADLNVDFINSTIGVSLTTNPQENSYTGSGSIASFYNSSISLNGGDNRDGSIAGRFVGSRVEGAIAVYKIKEHGPDMSDVDVFGTAVFKREGVEIGK